MERKLDSNRRIVLVKPNHPVKGILIPPIGLGYLAASVRENTDWDVFILDAFRDNLSLKKTIEEILRFDPDVVGITMYSRDYASVKRISAGLKQIKPGLSIIVGGPHPSAVPELTMNDIPELDYIIVGEGEIPLALFLNQISIGKNGFDKIPNLVRRDKQTKIIINPLTSEDNLDIFGTPAWDLIDPRKYPPRPHGAFFKNLPIAPIIVTRGCPYQCTYCGGHLVTGRKIRWRSIEAVIKEIGLLVERFGVKEIHIEDDNFTFNKDYVMRFCAELNKLKYELSLACPTGLRLDMLDEELVKTMESAGFYYFAVGVEIASRRLLKKLKRNMTPEAMKDKINMVARATRIRILALLLFGLPTETKDEIYETLKFALTMPFHRADFGIFVPLPGTEIFDELVKEGKLELESFDFENIMSDKVFVSLGDISLFELRLLKVYLNLRFYMRPKIIWGILKDIKRISNLNTIIRRIAEYFVK